MPAQHLFDSDSFSSVELTKSINALPLTPSTVGDLQIFIESGISTTKAKIERRNGVLKLIANSPRGGIPTPHQSSKRDMVEVETAHFVTNGAIYADSIQDVREFGGATLLQNSDSEIKKHLAEMRRNLDASLEHQRVGAVKGLVLDAAGFPLVDTFTEFDVAQQEQDVGLGNASSMVSNLIIAAIRKAESALGADAKPTGWAAIAAPDFMDALRAHPSLEAAVQGYQAAQILLKDHRFGALQVGDVQFLELRSPDTGPVYVPNGEAFLIPLGVPDLFVTHFSPPDWLEAANTVGLPYYSKAEPGPMNRFARVEAQSNSISLCTRPNAVIRLRA